MAGERRSGGRTATNDRRAGPRRRPSSEQLFAAVVDLVSNRSSTFKGTARRYSLCTADAEDAYQRSLEILMTKAPTVDRSELHPWLHTVIKHEALAIRRQRERLLAADESQQPDHRSSGSARSADEDASERERAAQAAEALRGLKAGEVKCILLKALGYSYDEISARTGFSWTKVNRSLTEGRKRFFGRFAEIQSGELCAHLRPMLSAASDGEASSEERRLLQAHLRACHSCRALLRGYRAIPARLAELVPPAIVPALERESWWSRLSAEIIGGAGDRITAAGHKLQQLGEAFSAQKATAVVASTAAFAGGAVVHERSIERHGKSGHSRAGHMRALRASERETPVAPVGQPLDVSKEEAAVPLADPPSADDPRSHSEVTPAAEASSIDEFLPEASAPAAPPERRASAPPADSQPPAEADAPADSQSKPSTVTAEFGP